MAEIAAVLGVSKQRAHVLLAGVKPLRAGHGGKGAGSVYRLEDVVSVLAKHRDKARADADHWQARIDALRARLAELEGEK